jgi:hypothetical protein
MTTGLLERRPDVPISARRTAAYRRYRRDVEYIREAKPELLNKYGDEWVAILRQRVIAHDGDLRRLLSTVARRHQNLRDVVIDFMTDQDQVLIL